MTMVNAQTNDQTFQSRLNDSDKRTRVSRRITPKFRREISDGDINPRRGVSVSLGDIFGVACDDDDDDARTSSGDSLLMLDSARAMRSNGVEGRATDGNAVSGEGRTPRQRGEEEDDEDEEDDDLNEIRYPATDSDDDYETDLENEPTGNFGDARQLQEQLYEKVCNHYHVTPVAHFKAHKDDTALILKHRGLGANGMKALSVPIQINQYIEYLNLQGNNIGYKGIKHLAFSLRDNTTLTHINISYNNLYGRGTRLICDAVRDSNYIKALDISGNGIEDGHAEYIVDLINNTTTLELLSISNNSFCEQGTCDIASALCYNTTLKKVNLSWNHIRLSGAKAMADMLKINQTILELDLSMNGLAEYGAKSIAEALSVNKTLRCLDISSNRIEQLGCIAIANALSKNVDLHALKIGLNPLTFHGTIQLIQCIHNNPNSTLAFLHMKYGVVSKGFMKVVNSIKDKRLFKILVGFVTISPEQHTKISDIACNDQNPIEILLLFMSEKNLRLLDLFKSLDKDQSGSLTREEFIDGLQSVDSPLSRSQLDELICMLDKDGDGEIDLTEILNINREFKDVKRKVNRQIMEKKDVFIKTKLQEREQQMFNRLKNSSEHKFLRSDTNMETSILSEIDSRKNSVVSSNSDISSLWNYGTIDVGSYYFNDHLTPMSYPDPYDC